MVAVAETCAGAAAAMERPSTAVRGLCSPHQGHCWGAFVGPLALQDGGPLATGHLWALSNASGSPVGRLWGLPNGVASAAGYMWFSHMAVAWLRSTRGASHTPGWL